MPMAVYGTLLGLCCLALRVAAVSAAGPPAGFLVYRGGDRHFMADALGFLRANSDGVGEAARSVLQVQRSLAEIRHHLGSEQAKWTRNRKELEATKKSSEDRIAFLQEQRVDEGKQMEKKLGVEAEIGHQRELQQKLIANRSVGSASNEEEKQWLKGQIAELEKQAAAAQAAAREKDVARRAAKEAILKENNHLQLTFEALGHQLQALDAHSLEQRRAQVALQSTLYQEMDAVLATTRERRKDLEEQAKIGVEIVGYHRRVTSQLGEVQAAQNAKRAGQGQCEAARTALLAQLSEAKQSLAKDDLALQGCQAMEAECGRLRQVLATGRGHCR